MAVKHKSALIGFVLIALLVLTCQNCSPVSHPASVSGQSDTKTNLTDGNGGQPYDGKLFVLLGDLCPDQTTIRTRIHMKSATEAQMVRNDCQDITPVTLASSDFQVDANNSNKIYFQGKALGAEGRINLSLFDSTQGFGIWIRQDFGTPADSSGNTTLSKLRLYENGVEMGPAHSWHADIAASGMGRFSHWQLTSGSGVMLLFSATDNSDPRTNGRLYTYVVAP